jgi:hypothetical protein
LIRIPYKSQIVSKQKISCNSKFKQKNQKQIKKLKMRFVVILLVAIFAVFAVQAHVIQENNPAVKPEPEDKPAPVGKNNNY